MESVHFDYSWVIDHMTNTAEIGQHIALQSKHAVIFNVAQESGW